MVWSCRTGIHGQPIPLLTAATDEDEEGRLPEDIMKVNALTRYIREEGAR